MATPVDVDTATVEKVQGTTRRSLVELEDAVAAAVESSGVGYLRPLVCFIPCDYYRSRDDTTLLFAALRRMTASRVRLWRRRVGPPQGDRRRVLPRDPQSHPSELPHGSSVSSFNPALSHPTGCAEQIAERCQQIASDNIRPRELILFTRAPRLHLTPSPR